jgi:formylglycine-generating enzyme required for sulfatase activity
VRVARRQARGTAWVLAAALVLGAVPAAAADRTDMVFVPGGAFVMGADATDGEVGVQVGVDSVPRHVARVAPFWIDRTEVTHAAYRAFVAATHRRPPQDPRFADFYSWTGDDYPEGLENHPVVYVDWEDADAYCAWRGKRLPTEAEWEKAARGTDGHTYPWGEGFDPLWCNTRETRLGWTAPVGTMTHDMSPYGVMDMCGNVSEWTADWYGAYPGSDLVRAAFGRTYKVARGGAWLLVHDPYARVTNRTLAFEPDKRHRSIGFRCAADAAPGDGAG